MFHVDTTVIRHFRMIPVLVTARAHPNPRKLTILKLRLILKETLDQHYK